MSQIVKSTEKVRYWSADGTVEREVTQVDTHDDGEKVTVVINAAPPGSRITNQAKYDRYRRDVDQERQDREIAHRTSAIEQAAHRRSALDKLTELGFSDDQIKGLTG